MTNANSEIETIEEERICISLEDENETQQPKHPSSSNKTESNINLRNEQFNNHLIEAIDETLAGLGESVKNTLYHNLESNFGIPKKDIPLKICDFSSILHKLFGLGASHLEVSFMKNLNEKVQADIKWPKYQWPLSKWALVDLSFEEYISKIREDFVKGKY